MVVATCLLAVPLLALVVQTTTQDDAGLGTDVPRAVVEPGAPVVTDVRELVTELDLWSAGIVESIDESSVGLHYFSGPFDSLEPLLQALGFDAVATMDRIADTLPTDGTLTATAPHATATWVYESDGSLSIAIDLTD